MNRADRNAEQEGGGKRRVNVGFALMTLQRRLASSPFAIFKSIVRRKERLEARLKEETLLLQGRELQDEFKIKTRFEELKLEDIDDILSLIHI